MLSGRQGSHRHQPFDLATGIAGADGQWEQAERGDERRHENGCEAFGCSAHGAFQAPRHAFDCNQVLEMRDHHNRVAQGDAEKRDEADERAD